MANPETDIIGQNSSEILTWENEPLSVEFFDVNADPNPDPGINIASTQRTDSGVYFDCYFYPDAEEFSSVGQVGIDPKISNLTIRAIRTNTKEVFAGLDDTFADKLPGTIVSRRRGAINLSVPPEKGHHAHLYTVEHQEHRNKPSILVRSGQTKGDSTITWADNAYEDVDAREHVKRHAEVTAIIANTFLATLRDSQAETVLAKFPLNQVPEEQPPAPDYLHVLEKFPNYSDFIGLDYQTSELKRAASLYFIQPELLEKYSVRPGAVFIHGPSGTGKTSLVQATAKEYGFDYLQYRFTDIFSTNLVGDPQRNLQIIYDEAREQDHPMLIFFDKCDGLFSANAGGNAGINLSLVTTLKDILEHQQEYPNVLSVFAANSTEGFDPTLFRTGLFNTIIPISTPPETVRVNRFLDKLVQQSGHFVTDLLSPDIPDEYRQEPTAIVSVLSEAISLSANFTPADYETVFSGLRQIRMNHELLTGEEPPLLTAWQLVEAIVAYKKTRPS
jgi:hypothetical protein